MNRQVRPILTYGVVGAYILLGGFFAYTGKINAETFFTGLAGTAGLMVGFWFGERSALKKPEDGNG